MTNIKNDEKKVRKHQQQMRWRTGAAESAKARAVRSEDIDDPGFLVDGLEAEVLFDGCISGQDGK